MSARPPKEIKITFDTVSILKLIGILVAVFLGLVFIMNIAQPLILIVISFFLAIALNPTVSWIAEKLKTKGRVSATGMAYVLVIGFLAAFFSFVFPPIISQTIDFLEEVPSTIQSTKDGDTAIGAFIANYELTDEIDKISRDFGNRFGDLGGPAIGAANKIVSAIVSTVVVLVLTFMMLVEGPSWIEKYFKSLKPKHRNRQKMLAKKMYKVVVGYVNGQVLIAALAGFFAALTLFIGSQILNVEVNAIALGGIVALFALIPLIGVILGSIIVILSSLAVSFPLAIIMTVFFIIYQQIESNTLQPYIQSRTNTLTPMLVLISALIGVSIAGLVGAILAIPTAGCIKIYLDDYFANRESKF